LFLARRQAVKTSKSSRIVSLNMAGSSCRHITPAGQAMGYARQVPASAGRISGMANEQRTTRGTRLALLLLMMLALPPAYVLSSGPVAWLLGDGELGMAAWNATYRPVGLLAEWTGTERPYARYVNWWTRGGSLL
jgi:hypothetical protein